MGGDNDDSVGVMMVIKDAFVCASIMSIYHSIS